MSDHSILPTTCTDCERTYPDLTEYHGELLCPSCLTSAISEYEGMAADSMAKVASLRYITARRLHEVRYKLTHGNPPPTLQAAYEATLAAWTEVEQVLGR